VGAQVFGIRREVKLYLVMMLAFDCNSYIFGAYRTTKAACAARAKCATLAQPWQQHETGLCVVQRIIVGIDNTPKDLLCGDEAGTRLEETP
jgi:hypothetical protein